MVVSQEKNECKVLVTRLEGTYKGSCKKGFAHGKGKAIGTDQYEGKFRNGFPNGSGTYTYSDGAVYDGEWKKGKREGYGKYVFKENEKDSVQEGLWENDIFTFKTKPVANYKVTSKRNIDRYRFIEIGNTINKIQVKVLRSGITAPVSDILLHGDSGSVVKNGGFVGFDNVTYPFIGKIQYTIPSKLNAQMLSVAFTFLVNKPGQWEIQLNH